MKIIHETILHDELCTLTNVFIGKKNNKALQANEKVVFY